MVCCNIYYSISQSIRQCVEQHIESFVILASGAKTLKVTHPLATEERREVIFFGYFTFANFMLSAY